MRFDAIVVGGGTAGCVLAARLSEDTDRSVCLVEAGPDHGPRVGGRWPAELLDARSLPQTNGWGPGGEDGRPLGGRTIGGSSAVNACMAVEGSPSDYDEWGAGWTYEELRPFLDRARATLRMAPSNTPSPSPFHVSFLEATESVGLPRLADVNDPRAPVGAAPFTANVVDGVRWNAAFAYLDEARVRPNLAVEPDVLVDRVVIDGGGAAAGVLTADERRIDADLVVLAAGAYFTPAILLRSGIGPAAGLRGLGIDVVVDLPVGERLLDHCGTDVAWSLSDELRGAALEDDFEAHAFAKVASTSCPAGTWDLHLLPWVYPVGDGEFAASVIVFHMKPLSTGRVRLASVDPGVAPIVERGFLSREEDLGPLLDGIALARRIGATEQLGRLLGEERAPGNEDPEAYVRATVRNYFHPAGTCAVGRVVDREGHVLGVDGLVVGDASIMPTIPRANTNLTTAAIAERIAASLGG